MIHDRRTRSASCSKAVREAFSPSRRERPRGRLILSFRKEWFADFDAIRKSPDLKLDMKSMMLRPLDRSGVIEAIEGPADHFRLVINPNRGNLRPRETTLAEFIADGLFDTLVDPQDEQESPRAPTLQMLLTRMWREAYGRNPGRPIFDCALYQELKGKGFKLSEVIQEQFAKIAKVEGLRKSVEMGLLLDLLEFFTTREGTADSHTRGQIRHRYQQQPAERLDALLEACQNRYLLAYVGEGADRTAAYRLTHDALAPLLRERFRLSLDPAQRARHAMEGRATTWKGQPSDPVLDRFDLAAVEQWLPWMRTLEEEELDLLRASKQSEERRVAEAEKSRRLAESRRLAVLSDDVRPQRLDLAMLLAVEAVKQQDTREARRSLQRSLDERPEVVRFLHLPEGFVTSVAVDPLNRIAAGYDCRGRGGVLLFDASGERLPDTPLKLDEGPVRSVAFGPEGLIAAAYEGGVVLFNASGERSRPAPLDIKEGIVTSVAIGPQGQIAAGYCRWIGDVLGGLVLFDARGERVRHVTLGVDRAQVTSVAFGPQGQIAAATKDDPHLVRNGPITCGGRGVKLSSSGGVLLLDPSGEPLRSAPIEVKEGDVVSVAFSPAGRIAAAYDCHDKGGVLLLDATGDRVGDAPLEVNEGSVTCVALGPRGQIAVSYNGGVVLMDDSGKRLGPGTLEVREAYSVRSVAIGPQDRIAAGYSCMGEGGGVVVFDANHHRLRPMEQWIPEGRVESVAVAEEGTIAVGYECDDATAEVMHEFHQTPADSRGGVLLFDGRGKRLFSLPLDVPLVGVMSVSFGPHGRLAAAYQSVDGGGDGVLLFDASGNRLESAPLTVEGTITSMAFRPGGRISVGYVCRGRGMVTLFDASGKQLQFTALDVIEGAVEVVVFGLTGQIATGYKCHEKDESQGGGVVLFDARGERLGSVSLDVPRLGVTRIAFGPQGQFAAGFHGFHRAAGGVVLFSPAGERVHPLPLMIKEGNLTSLAFGPAGELAAGYSDGVFCGVVLFDAAGERLRPEPLKVEDGWEVTSVAFGPAGQLAAGYAHGWSGGFVMLDADPVSWRRKAEETAGRNFKSDEWIQYFPGTPYRRTIRSLPWPHDLPEAERKQAEAFEMKHPEGTDAL